MPAASWFAVIAQVPTELKPMTPAAETEQTVLEVEYVTGKPDVDVACGTGGVLVKGVFGSGGKVMLSVTAVVARVTVCGMAAA